MPLRGKIFTPAPVAKHPLNEGLQAWWLGLPGLSGGPNLFDARGRFPGTLTNGPTWVGYSSGPEALGAVLFDGSNDYVALGTDLFNTDTSGTVAYWVRPVSTAADGATFCATTSGDDNHIVNIRTAASGAVFVQAYFATGAVNNAVQTATGLLTAGVPAHVVMTSNGSAWTCYVNGVAQALSTVLVGSNTGQWWNFLSGATVLYRFGFLNATFPNPLSSAAWDIRYYNRALPAVEVAGLYEQSLRGHPDTLARRTNRTTVVLTPPAVTGDGVWLLTA